MVSPEHTDKVLSKVPGVPVLSCHCFNSHVYFLIPGVEGQRSDQLVRRVKFSQSQLMSIDAQ